MILWDEDNDDYTRSKSLLSYQRRLLFNGEQDHDASNAPPLTCSSKINNNNDNHIAAKSGSLHQIALDMINNSSPKGSPSYLKLRHILSTATKFHILLRPRDIFNKNEDNISQLLWGAGLQRVSGAKYRQAIEEGNANDVILVETLYTKSACPILQDHCRDRPRVYIQSEQLSSPDFVNFREEWLACHVSANCVIAEFSDYNRDHYEEVLGDSSGSSGSGSSGGNSEEEVAIQYEPTRPWEDSVILLPVMTQTPSRISHLLPQTITPLRERKYDIVFFGYMSQRRLEIAARSNEYLEMHPEKVHAINTTIDRHEVARFYGEAKVCLLVHAYDDKSAGEYHRYSEFGPYG